MDAVGNKRLAKKAEAKFGGPVEAATVVGDFTNVGTQVAKAFMVPKPQKMLNLLVMDDQLRLFDAALGNEFKKEVFAKPCSAITQVQRTRGALGARVRVTFADGEQLQFRQTAGVNHGSEVVEFIARKACVSVGGFD
jgi:hypothetical protein